MFDCRTADLRTREILYPMQPVTYISGATGFAGSKIADHLALQGFDLLVGGKDSIKLQSLKEKLSEKYPKVRISSFTCDLSRPDFWEENSSSLKNFYVKNYINCSGVQGKLGPVSEISYEETVHVFNVNLFSSIFFTNLFAENIKIDQELSIIHFSGGGSTGPRPLFIPYSLSKTSLVRFVENFAAENMSKRIRINAIAPGVMPSRMQEEIMRTPGMEKSQDYLVAEKSLSIENSVTTKLFELCDFLVSDKSRGISGKLISSNWDNWPEWPKHLAELESSDLYTLRRITGRDRGCDWGDL